jgi:SNF2 family DNA or RNA helicase
MDLELHQYQKDAVRFALEHPDDAAWFVMDCGTGKTLPAIATLEELFMDGRVRGVLVVAPLKVMQLVWPAELRHSWLTSTVIHGKNKEANLRGDRKCVYLTSYDTLPWLVDTLGPRMARWPFDAVVFDESSFLKSPGSQRFRAMRSAFAKRAFRFTLLLTASPRPNSLLDLWTQAFILDGGKRLDTCVTRFKARFFYEDRQTHVCREHPGASETVHKKIQDLCYRVSREETRNYPECHIVDRRVEIPRMEEYRDLEEEMCAEINGQTITAENVGVVTGKCLQFAGGNVYNAEGEVVSVHGAKVRELLDIVSEHREPVIIAYGYQHEADDILANLPGAWDMRKLKSQAAMQRMQTEWDAGRIPYLVMHPASGGHGLNLQRGGRIVIWYGMNWSYDLWEQLNSRVWRQGQTKECLVYRIIAEDTVDEAVVAAIDRKARGQNELFEVLNDYRNT